MKLKSIISACGLDPNNYTHIAENLVEVFDRKNRIIEEADFSFSEAIFKENSDSFKAFQKFLDTVKKNDQIQFFLNDTYIVVKKKGSVPRFIDR